MTSAISPERQARLTTFIRESFNLTDTVTAARSEMWRRVEERYRAFINPTETHLQSGNVQFPFDENIIIPYSYALVQAIVAYFFTLFTAQSPLKQVQDAQGSNYRGADLMELLIAHFDRLNDANQLLYGAMLDSQKYGFGGGKTLWEETFETRSQRVMRPVSLLGINLGMTEEVAKKTVKTYDGPLTTLFDPWLMAFDPRVPLSDFQKGNFVGETIFTSWYGLKEHEAPYGPYEDVDKIPRWGYKDAIAVARQTSRLQVLNLPNYFDAWVNEQDRGFCMLEQLWAKIIPSDLDLGPGTRPEMWLMTLANRQTLIQAEHADLPRGKFPYWAVESSPDMHSTMNPGTMEILMPLEDLMNWLINCHDMETSILTSRGWVPFPSLRPNDEVATVDPETSAWWYERPKRIIAEPYQGPMVHLHTSRLDAMMTPNHRLWLSKYVNRRDEQYTPYAMLDAGVVASSAPRTKWRTRTVLGTFLPAVLGGSLMLAEYQSPVRRGRPVHHMPTEIPCDALAPFLGWFVSEGNVVDGGKHGEHVVRIRQKKREHIARIDEVVARIPLHVCRQTLKNGSVAWNIYDCRLSGWIKDQCGTRARERRIPDIVFSWPKHLRAAFFDAAMAGDGGHVEGTCFAYTTTSPWLADDMQRLAIGLGWNASIARVGRRHPGPNHSPAWAIRLNSRGRDIMFESKDMKTVQYNGMVYCVENSTHLIVTRRRGRVMVGANSHFENIRKALNDMFVVDPERVYLSDLLNPGPMKVIRLRPEFYGTDVRQVVQQLQVQDVTRTHLQDVAMIFDLMQRISAALDALMGVPSARRRTATESAGSMQLAANRLKVYAQLMSSMGLSKWGQQQAALIQAHMTRNEMVQIVGPRKSEEYSAMAEGTVIEVTPEDIMGEWNFPIHDGSMPLDPVRMADTWEKVLAGAARIPEIAMQYDLGKIFERGLRTLGIRDVSELKKTGGSPSPARAQVLPDGEVARRVQSGDLVPITNGGPARGGPNGAGAGQFGVSAPS